MLVLRVELLVVVLVSSSSSCFIITIIIIITIMHQVEFALESSPGVDFEFKIVSAELKWKQVTCDV